MDWLWQLDQELFRAIHGDMRQGWLDPMMLIITQMGLGHVQFGTMLVALMPQRRRWTVPAALALVIVIGLSVPQWREVVLHQTLREGFGLVVLTMLLVSRLDFDFKSYFILPLVSGVAAGLIRLTMYRGIGRLRPSNLEWAEPIESVRAATSFPSGHTTTSFAIAFSLMYLTRGRDDSWIGTAALVWASLVGFSRVYVGVHWPTDVIGGAALGLAVATLVHLLWGGRTEEREGSVST